MRGKRGTYFHIYIGILTKKEGYVPIFLICIYTRRIPLIFRQWPYSFTADASFLNYYLFFKFLGPTCGKPYDDVDKNSNT